MGHRSWSALGLGVGAVLALATVSAANGQSPQNPDCAELRNSTVEVRDVLRPESSYGDVRSRLLEQALAESVQQALGVEVRRSLRLRAEQQDASISEQLVEQILQRSRGRVSSYAYLAVPRAVFVVPGTDAGEVVFVRQYRHPVRDWTLEVPAGSVEDGETPLEAAERELGEEVGGRARDWRHLTTFYSSSAHLSLRSDAFLATGVLLGTPEPGEDEDVVAVHLPVEEALARARAGRLVDGQTALALLLAAPHLGPPGR